MPELTAKQRAARELAAQKRAAVKMVRERARDLCEVCGQAPMTNFHHRKNKGQGGAYSAENGLGVCGSGTTGCHGRITQNPTWAKDHGWSVSAYADPAAEPVLLAAHGRSYLTADGAIVPAGAA